MFTTEILYLVLLVVCILLSAFFSSAEIAFMSLQRVRLENMVETKVKGAKRVAKIMEKPERFLSTVRTGDTFVDTAGAVIATVLAVSFLGQRRGLIVATLAFTFVTLIFSDMTPRTIAVRNSEKVALSLARPIEIVSWLFSPIVILVSGIVSLLTRAFGGTTVPRTTTSAEEIRTLIRMGSRDGAVEAEEAEMLHNVFEFGDRPVREIMVPRPDVVGIRQGTKIAEYLALYAACPHSRMPVYKDNLDNILGMISDREVFVGMANGTVNNDTLIDKSTRPVYFTPDSKPISKLFSEMREKNLRMTVVVDEYGGTAGIVTLRSIVEEVFGEIGSEIGPSEKDFEIVDEHTFQIDGSMRIEDINEEMGLGLPEGGYETISGFIMSVLGHIPRQGEQLRYKNLKITATRMEGVKIDEVLITREAHAAATHPVQPG